MWRLLLLLLWSRLLLMRWLLLLLLWLGWMLKRLLLLLLRLLKTHDGSHGFGTNRTFRNVGRIDIRYQSHFVCHEATARVVSASAHSRHEHGRCDQAWNGLRGPLSALFVPTLPQNIQQQATCHFCCVRRIKIWSKVVGGNSVAQQIDTMRTRHFFGGGTPFDVCQLRVQVLRPLFSPRVNDAFGMGEVAIHVLDRLPADLLGERDRKRSLHPSSAVPLEILVKLIVHEFQAPVRPLIGR
mmetsp:Transcript_53499/g.81147  ORF Transcript_53499/g.81147 Transcript_53499/m.81147 type:complete len:240 (-) Transcript_53499:486-1205(-)